MSATKKKYLHSHAANSRHFYLFLTSDVNVRILTDAQAREVLDIAIKYREKLLQQWKLLMPVSAFPSLKKVPVKERNNWYLMGGGVTWDSCPEVIHIEQILGNYQNYAHELA